MTQLVAKINTTGDVMTVSLASCAKDGISADEKMLAARLVKAFANDPTMRPIASKLWLHGQQSPKQKQ